MARIFVANFDFKDNVDAINEDRDMGLIDLAHPDLAGASTALTPEWVERLKTAVVDEYQEAIVEKGLSTPALEWREEKFDEGTDQFAAHYTLYDLENSEIVDDPVAMLIVRTIELEDAS
jgi:hypothetical protein